MTGFHVVQRPEITIILIFPEGRLMKVRFVDNCGYFDDGYYTAKITKIEPYKTNYGHKLLVWFKITNEHNRSMLVNDFLPNECTKNNMLYKVYTLACQEKGDHGFDTDEMIGKFIGIVLYKKIKKGKTYLNISNYLPIKQDEPETAKNSGHVSDQTISQLATILRNNPTLARAIVKEVKKEPKLSRIKKRKTGISPIGDVIEDMKKGTQE